jgi:hypothetical protein
MLSLPQGSFGMKGRPGAGYVNGYIFSGIGKQLAVAREI